MFLSSLTEALARLFAPADPLDTDAIDHPLLQGMSLRDLADLPFPRPEAPEPQAHKFLTDLPQAAAIAPPEPNAPSPEVLPHAA